MIHPLRDWDRFFFAPQRARVLGLFRIALGLMVIYSFILWARDATTFFSDEGLLTTHSLDDGMFRAYHTLLYYFTSPWAVRLALAAVFATAILFTVGYQTRIVTLVLFVLVVSFHERNNLVLNSGDTILRNMLFFFLFAPAGTAYSVDSLIRRLRTAESEDGVDELCPPWAQRMMAIQVSVVYFTTAYAKSRGDLWHAGHAIYYVLGLIDFNKRGVEQLMNYPVIYSALSFATLFGEVIMAFILWFRAARPYAVLLGLFIHGWIIATMTIPVFGIIMLLVYIPFFSEEELDEGLVKWRARFSTRRATVYFDAECPLCQRTRRLVRRLDLLERTQFVDVHGLSPAQINALGRTPGTLLAEMHLCTTDGTVLSGFAAMRWLIARMPATLWMAPVLYLPGAERVGNSVYAWVAQNRLILVSCNGAACRVHRS